MLPANFVDPALMIHSFVGNNSSDYVKYKHVIINALPASAKKVRYGISWKRGPQTFHLNVFLTCNDTASPVVRILEFGYMVQTELLIRDCLKNNRAAQKQLYQLHAPVMLGVCYRYTKSLADAEDVLQESFVRVFKHLDQYKGDRELGAWIRRILVTTALNYLKRNSKYQYDLAFDKIEMHPVSDDNPEVALDIKELTALIQQLPTGYQAIFNLHAVEGYSHVEIGALLGISDGTSRSQYARARALLITWIKKLYSDHKLQAHVK